MKTQPPYPELQPIPEDVPNKRLGAIAGLADYQAQWHRRLPDIVGEPRPLSLFDIVYPAGAGAVAVVVLAASPGLFVPGLFVKAIAALILFTLALCFRSQYLEYRKRKRKWKEALRIACDSEALAKSIREQSRVTPADDAEAAKRIEARFRSESEALRKRIHAGDTVATVQVPST